ncbi:MAG: carboxypeptidase regulatory-like domain-containing protein [Myxococcota bacterium]|jgi:predicted CXXCH cytochrome family protein|nr:carboxypeptidase regulatory-like domain-containing protein [Myxococcota bacterium]
MTLTTLGRRSLERCAVLLGVLLAACSGAGTGAPPLVQPPDAEPPPPALVVSGQVRDALTTGPLAGAQVTLDPSGRSTESRAGGLFQIEVPAAGTYRLTVVADGYQALDTVPFEVSPERRPAQDCRLYPVPTGKAVLAGRVVDSRDRPMVGVLVTLPPSQRQAVSDVNGEFLFTAVHPGTYGLRAAAPSDEQADGRRGDVALLPDQGVLVRLVLPDRSPASGEFVGSARCRECHEPGHDRWQASGHARALLPVDQGPARASLRELGIVEVDLGAGRTAVLRGATEDVTVVLPEKGAEPVVLPVVAWLGSGTRGQVPLAEVDGELFALPVAFTRLLGGWTAREPEAWYDAGASPRAPHPAAAVALGCAGCHATGLELFTASSGRAATRSANPGEPGRWVEPGVGCESCHGPGGAHAAYHDEAPEGSPSWGILNPADLDLERRADVCARCHARGTATGTVAGEHPWFPFGPAGFPAPWESLASYWTESAVDWPGLAVSRGNHQQALDLRRGGHGRNGQYVLGCADCHDPHGPVSAGLPAQLRLPVVDNTLCLQCHGRQRFAGPQSPALHGAHRTFDPGGQGSGRCVGCHMPRTSTNLGWSARTWRGELADHSLRVNPPLASRPGTDAHPGAQIPSACLTCHLEVDDRRRATGGFCPCPTGSPADAVALERLQEDFARLFPAAGRGEDRP